MRQEESRMKVMLRSQTNQPVTKGSALAAWGPPNLMTIDQEKGDLGVIIAEKQVTPRTHARKFMGNQGLGSHYVLKIIEKVEDTMLPLKTTQNHTIPIRSIKSNWNCYNKYLASARKG